MADMPFNFKNEDEYHIFLIELGKVLKYPCGKRVLNTLMGICGIFETGNNFQNQAEAFKSGQRNIGLQLLIAIMDLDYGKTYTEMLGDYWKLFHNRDK